MFSLVSYSEVGHALTQGQQFPNPVAAMDYGNRIAGMAAVGRIRLFEDQRLIASLDPDGRWR